jgi:glycosyltransferase involved in cell wall biosynthesis
MPPLRIHFLTQYISQTGTYFRFHNLAVGLAKLGQQVTVFGGELNTSSKERVETHDGIKYHIIPEYKGMSVFGSCHPLTALRRCFFDYPACDVAHLFQPYPGAALPWMWALRKKTKLMFYDWDDLYKGGLMNGETRVFRDYWTEKWVTYLEQRLPKTSNHVTTCSQFLARMATERKALKVSVIPNGFWPFAIPEKRAARESLGLDPEAVYVGFMGRTVNELSWCLEALGRNAQRHEKLRFALCGPTIETLKKAAPDVLRRVDYLGSLPPLKTREFAAAIDLGLLPLEDNQFNQSRFPIKYAEYMAAGTPVLCSDVGECAQLFDNLPWILKAGKTKSQWLDSFDRALAMLTNGQVAPVDVSLMEKSLSWDSISRSLLSIYSSEMREAQGVI